MPDSPNPGELSTIEFSSKVSEFAAKVSAAIQINQSIQELVDGSDLAVFIKAINGQILVANTKYQEMFGGTTIAIGRKDSDFLHETIRSVAQASDSLIVSGCQFIIFEHAGIDSIGRAMRMRTFKRSLIGLGHPKMTILGISEVIEVAPQKLKRQLSLPEKWAQFHELEARDQEIAKQLAFGITVRDIAATCQVSDKTVENHRKHIFERLGLQSTAELIKLLVRLQDNGFADFGL